MKIGDGGNSNKNYDKSCDNDNEIINDLNNYINKNNEFVYDDDAIEILANTLNISYDLADKFRRCISKINGMKK